MSKLSYGTFSSARVLMAICVFFCHVFERFNDFGFLFVGVFFFMSGYGMEYMNKRMFALTRTVPYILYFVWFSLVYLLFFRVFIYPSSWFLVVYFVLMVIYRFVKNMYALLWSFIGLAFFFCSLEFEFGWSASFGGFLFGVFYGRDPSNFNFWRTICFVPMFSLAFIWHVEAAFWCLIPFFSWCVLSICSHPVLRKIAPLGDYTFYFYCIHCFCLGLFGATWTLGGSPSVLSVLLAFLLSCFLSFFFKEYLFNYPRILK